MNDDIHGRNDAILHRLDTRARYGHIEKRLKHRKRRRWGGRLLALGGFLVLAGGLSMGARGNYSQQQEVTATAKQGRDFVPSLRVAAIEASPATASVSLPGTTAAFAATNIYARATGYIAKRNVDIGDRVEAGAVLVQLAVPELDDQISQNEATLNQLKSALDQVNASLKLAQDTWSRDEPLVNKGWVTQQQGSRGRSDREGTRGRSCRRPAQRHGAGERGQAAPSQPGLRLGDRAVRGRHHPA
jgi:multidrug efflux pump subunit AcrA (membrane-fusion protein)